MRKKKVLALMMAAAMSVGLLAGCGASSSGGGASAPAAGGDAASTETAAPAEGDAAASGDVVTLKWVTVGNGMPSNYDAWLEQINPYLAEKIGVNIDMEIVPWGDWENRRSVITNSGEYFDILFTDQSRYNSEVATGVLMDITDLVKTASPELYSMIPEDYWKAVSVQDKIYGVPTYKDSSITEYFIWDKDIADKYSIDINSIDSYEKLVPALEKIKEGEGGSPYYMSKNGADFLVTWQYDQLGAGLPALGIRYDDDTMTVVNPLEDEDILSNLDYIHKMYVDGVINGDAPNADDSNKYRMFFVAQGWSGAAASTWGPNNGIENCVAVQFGDTVVSNTSVRGSINTIYSGCKNPEKALEFLQLVNTDSKVRDWLYYGVEGENFNYTEDGKVEKLNTDWSMAGYTQGTFFNVSLLAEDEVNQWDEVKALNEAAVPSVMLGFDMDTSAVETELANCRAVYEKYKAEFWTGAQDPRELSQKIHDELDAAGWETIRAAAQEQVDAWKAAEAAQAGDAASEATTEAAADEADSAATEATTEAAVAEASSAE